MMPIFEISESWTHELNLPVPIANSFFLRKTMIWRRSQLAVWNCLAFSEPTLLQTRRTKHHTPILSPTWDQSEPVNQMRVVVPLKQQKPSFQPLSSTTSCPSLATYKGASTVTWGGIWVLSHFSGVVRWCLFYCFNLLNKGMQPLCINHVPQVGNGRHHDFIFLLLEMESRLLLSAQYLLQGSQVLLRSSTCH